MKHILNPEIERVLREHNIPYNEGMMYLLALYYNLDEGLMVSEAVVKQVNQSGIVTRDYSAEEIKPTWNIPLYEEGEASDKAWGWVDTFRGMFFALRPDAAGPKGAVDAKMKKFFSTHPEVRADDVIAATKLYLREFPVKQNIKYLQRADYFIAKSDKGVPTSRLEMYLEAMKKVQGANDVNNKYMREVID